MGNRIIICGDQPFSPTREPYASESRSWFSVPQPETSSFKTAVPPSLNLFVQSTVLPSVTTILGPGATDVNPPDAAIPSGSGDCFAVETRVGEGNLPPPGGRRRTVQTLIFVVLVTVQRKVGFCCDFLVLCFYVVGTPICLFTGVPKSGKRNVSVKIASSVEQFGDIPSPTFRDLMHKNWSSECSLLLSLSNLSFVWSFSLLWAFVCVGQDDDVVANMQSSSVSSRNLADFGRHLVEEVETRAIRSIETGWFVIVVV